MVGADCGCDGGRDGDVMVTVTAMAMVMIKVVVRVNRLVSRNQNCATKATRSGV
jgi:hypothetical protein